MLSGRYPSDEFAELRPRITWDRLARHHQRTRGREASRGHQRRDDPRPRPVRRVPRRRRTRRGPRRRAGRGNGVRKPAGRNLRARRVVLAHRGDHARPRPRVSGPGRARQDAVLEGRPRRPPAGVRPGDRRSSTRTLLRLPPAAAVERLTRDHDLDAMAAENLLQYLHDQMEATRAVPDASHDPDRARPRRARRLARLRPLAPAAAASTRRGRWRSAAKIREERGIDVETLWGDDGFVVRFPTWTNRPTCGCSCRIPTRCRRWSSGSWARRRCSRRSSARTPPVRCCCPGGAPACARRSGSSASARPICWPSRRKYGSFPMLLETYRECLRDFFDMPALVETLADVRSRRIRVATVDSEQPSPFAASLLFSYVASFLYDGDAPLAERRAQALAVDQAQLRDLIGDIELRELLDADSMQALERELQRLDPRYHAKSLDGVHDMLLSLGDLSAEEIAARTAGEDVAASAAELVRARRVLPVRVAGRGALHRRRRRRPLPRRARRAAARRRSRIAPRRRAGPARQPGQTLRAHARAVCRPGVRGPVRASASRWPKTRSRASPPTVNSSKASSRQAAQGTSGPTPVCCVSCGGGRSRNCGTRSNPSNNRCSDG